MGNHGIRSLAPIALFVVATGCGSGGDGDIGPRLLRLPDASYRALVRDDAGRAVVNAAMVISSAPNSAAFSDADGRFDFYTSPTGRVTFRVDTTHATARDGDTLAPIFFAADAGIAQMLEPVVHLADLAPSAGLSLDAGILAANERLDDSATSGAVLELVGGTAVGFGGAARDTIRTGMLRSDHVPPVTAFGGVPSLVTRAVHIGPAGVTLTATLTLPNDIGIRANGGAELRELDPTDGEWRVVGAGTADATASTITTTAPIALRGTLYAFRVAAPAAATFVGHVRQLDATRDLAFARVRAGQVTATCDSGGRFTLSGVPIAAADGTPIRPLLSISGGRTSRPGLVEIEVDPAQPDLGDIPTDIEGVVDLRSLVIARGSRFPFATVNIGSAVGDSGTVAVAGDLAEMEFSAIGDRYAGFLSTAYDPRDPRRVLSLDGRVFLREGRRTIDQSLFFGSESWLTSDRSGLLVVPVDPLGGGRLASVDVFRRVAGVDHFEHATDERFDARVNVGTGVEVLATLVTTAGTRRQFSACSVRDLHVGRAEFPLPRIHRAPLGSYEPFGVVQGDFRIPFGPSGTTTPTYRVVTTGILNADVWLDAALTGASLAPRAPVFLDPERDGGTAFRRGLPSRGGHIAAIRGESTAGRFTMQSMTYDVSAGRAPGVVVELPTSGSGSVAFDTDFVATGFYGGLDPAIAVDSVRADLAVLLPDTRAVEIARGHDGNLVRTGNDAVLHLSALQATTIGNTHWLAVLGGSADVGGTLLRQRAIVEFASTAASDVSLLPLPLVSSPQSGAQVPQAAFTVEFTAPVGTSYIVLRLHGSDSDTARDWCAILPGDATSFTFRRLPRITDSNQLLVPGQYTLEIEAARIRTGRALQQDYPVYQAVAARFIGIGAYERKVDALSSVRIPIEVVQ
ncbi:MAG: hypothetical protein U1F36_20045 [Planctomycetota bacterium]